MSNVPADPTTRFVRSLEGTYYMLREAAEILGVRHTKLRELLHADPELGPSYCTYLGKIKIYLYTPDDIDRLRGYLSKKRMVYHRGEATARTGRPMVWTREERKLRQRLYSRNYYYRKQADRLRSEGDADGAEQALRIADELAQQLEKMEPSTSGRDPEAVPGPRPDHGEGRVGR